MSPVSLLSAELAQSSISMSRDVERGGGEAVESDGERSAFDEGDSADETESSQIESSDESLPAYDLTDDRSDLTGAQAPRYLRQVCGASHSPHFALNHSHSSCAISPQCMLGLHTAAGWPSSKTGRAHASECVAPGRGGSGAQLR